MPVEIKISYDSTDYQFGESPVGSAVVLQHGEECKVKFASREVVVREAEFEGVKLNDTWEVALNEGSEEMPIITESAVVGRHNPSGKLSTVNSRGTITAEYVR